MKTYASAQAFMKSLGSEDKGCLVTDVRMPGMNGFEMLAMLTASGKSMLAIVVTGQGDIPWRSRPCGPEQSFIEKPVSPETLLAALDRAFRQVESSDGAITERSARRAEMAMRLASLTKREHEVMDPVVAGTANKAIVARLCISQRTVETTAPHS